MAVAGEELAQPLGIGGMAGADQLHPALAVADQRDAAQDEGAHDRLADVGLAGDQLREGCRDRHPDEFCVRPLRAAADEDGATR